jgi:hypothetical protein
MSVQFKKNEKKTVESERKKGEGFMGKDKDDHPSYGLLSLGTMSCSPGRQLFGAGTKHSHLITLRITRATRSRDNYSESYFDRDRLIEVLLSPAQFANLMTRQNTIGVPCTLNYIKGEGRIEDPPEHNLKQELVNDVDEVYKVVGDRVKTLKAKINNLLTGTVKKDAKAEILSMVHMICNDVTSNLHYLKERQMKTLERMGTEVVAEAEAAINGLIESRGLQALQDEIKQMGFSGDKQDDDIIEIE